jgi:uncharacterized membrane protein
MRIKFIEFNSRSFLKMVSWRILVSITNFFGGWISSGSWKVGIGVVGFALVINSLMYFVHERTWNIVQWGKDAPGPDMAGTAPIKALG